METKAFYQLLEKPTALSDKQREELKKMMQDYPFFSTPFILNALDLIKKKDPSIYEELKSTSLYLQNKNRIIQELDKAAITLQSKDEEEVSAGDSSTQKQVNPAPEGPVRVELPGDLIEKKDFTNEIIQEITLIGKGVKATKMESFDNPNQVPKPTEKPEEKKGVKAAETAKIEKKENKPEPAKIKDTTPAKERKVEEADEAVREFSTEESSEPKSLADEVMANLAKMRAERDANRKRLGKAEDALDKLHIKDEPKETRKKEVKPKVAAKKTPKKDSAKTVAKKENDQKESTSRGNTRKKDNPDSNLIESFINADVRIKPKEVQEDANMEDLSKQSTELPSNLISENLANIFEKQGKSVKAIAIYKQLILKYPEKKSYFAQKINNLEEK